MTSVGPRPIRLHSTPPTTAPIGQMPQLTVAARPVGALAYDHGSVPFRLDGTPYVTEEGFLTGRRNDHAILRLRPRID